MSETESTIDIIDEQNGATVLEVEPLDLDPSQQSHQDLNLSLPPERTENKSEQELEGEKFIPDIEQRFASQEIEINYKTNSAIDAVGKIQDGEIWYKNPLTGEYESGLEAAGENFHQQYVQQKQELLETGKSIFQFEIEGKINFIVQELIDGQVNSYHYEVTPKELEEPGKGTITIDGSTDVTAFDDENLKPASVEVIEVTVDDIFGKLVPPTLGKTRELLHDEAEPEEVNTVVTSSNVTQRQQPSSIMTKPAVAMSPVLNSHLPKTIYPRNKLQSENKFTKDETTQQANTMQPRRINKITEILFTNEITSQSEQKAKIQATEAIPGSDTAQMKNNEVVNQPVQASQQNTAPVPAMVINEIETSTIIEKVDTLSDPKTIKLDTTPTADREAVSSNESEIEEIIVESDFQDKVKINSFSTETLRQADKSAPTIHQDRTFSKQKLVMNAQDKPSTLEAKQEPDLTHETNQLPEVIPTPLVTVEAVKSTAEIPKERLSIDEKGVVEFSDITSSLPETTTDQAPKKPAIVQNQTELTDSTHIEQRQILEPVVTKPEQAPQIIQQAPEKHEVPLSVRTTETSRHQTQPTPIKLQSHQTRTTQQLAALNKLLEHRQSPAQPSQPELITQPARRSSFQETDRSRPDTQKAGARTEAASSIIKVPPMRQKTMPRLAPETFSESEKKPTVQTVTNILRNFTSSRQSVIRSTESTGKVANIEQFLPRARSGTTVNTDDDKINTPTPRNATARAA